MKRIADNQRATRVKGGRMPTTKGAMEMSQATMTCRSSRFALHDRFRPNADAREMTNYTSDTLRRDSLRRSSAPPEPSLDLAAKSAALTGGRADERVARVLLIDRDPGPISNQLRQAFS